MNEVIKISTDGYNGTTILPDIEILALVDENDPILKSVCPEFDFDDPVVDPVEFSSQLVETCKVKNGYGLASNQVGQLVRMFVMGAGEEYVAMFNPKILQKSEEETLLAEGCLSFPMLALKVSRSNKIVIQYQDFNGEEHNTELHNLSAHVFQHELDHLDGICYTERAKPMALKMGLKKRGKFEKLVERYNAAQNRLNNLSK